MTTGCGRAIGPRVVKAPNHGKAINMFDKPSDEQLQKAGVDQHLFVTVGPPKARLSVWVYEPRGGAISINLINRWHYSFNQDDRPARPDNAPLGTILVLHGLYDHTEGYNGQWGRIFAAAGYRAILVDLRGHGRSTGDWMTYGVIERQDVSQVIDHLEQQDLLAGQLGVFGISYGGAVAIQTAAVDDRIAAVNTVAAFSSLPAVAEPFGRTLVTRRIGELGWLLVRGAVPEALRTAGRAANFDPAQASPLQAIQQVQVPVRLIHGQADRHVPPEHALALYEASGRRSELMLIEQATHLSLPFQRVPQVRRLALEFFDQHLPADKTVLIADRSNEQDEQTVQ